MSSYTRMGPYPVIPVADLQNLASDANRQDDTRRGASGALGKRAGIKVLADLGSGSYAFAIADGEKSSDLWQRVDGAAEYIPVNLLNLSGGAAWTLALGCTYADGLLTADGVDDPTVLQSVTLQAGKYRLTFTAAGEGTTASHAKPKLVVSDSGGALVTHTATPALHPTAAEDATGKTTYSYDFELSAAGAVDFSISVVDETGALAAGSAYIAFEALEAIN